MPFLCSICNEESTRICVRCTKDACNNHLCEKCLRCSDCCECEVTLSEEAVGPPLGSARAAIRAAAGTPPPEPDLGLAAPLSPDTEATDPGTPPAHLPPGPFDV